MALRNDMQNQTENPRRRRTSVRFRENIVAKFSGVRTFLLEYTQHGHTPQRPALTSWLGCSAFGNLQEVLGCVCCVALCVVVEKQEHKVSAAAAGVVVWWRHQHFAISHHIITPMMMSKQENKASLKATTNQPTQSWGKLC